MALIAGFVYGVKDSDTKPDDCGLPHFETQEEMDKYFAPMYAITDPLRNEEGVLMFESVDHMCDVLAQLAEVDQRQYEERHGIKEETIFRRVF